jgi:dihydropyrimidinase/dihydroorotase
MTDLTLRNGLVVTPSGLVNGGLSATGGVITHVGADAALPPGDRDIDVQGKVIFPGVIDPHTHMGVGIGWGPEKMQRDFATESRDAAIGGITTMVTTSLMGTDSRVEVTRAGIEWGNRDSQVDFRQSVVMTTREQVREIDELVHGLGVRSFKFFLGYNGEQAVEFGMPPEGVAWDFFYEACEAIAATGTGALAMIHAEEPDVRRLLFDRYAGTSEGGLLQTWHRASPNILEPMQIYSAALIGHEVGAAIYVVHVSAAESVDLVRDLRRRGWEIYGETLGAFLYWTAEEGDAKDLGAYGKIQPPIRQARDRDALWTGILDGTITNTGTDTQMYTRESRRRPFWEAQVGLGPQLATFLPSVYTSGVLGGRCTLEDLARVMAENNARRFGLYPDKGVLQVGSDADVVVFDPALRRVARADRLESACGYTIYEGEKLGGWPERVFVRGTPVVEDGRIVTETPVGRWVPTVRA